MQYPNTLKIKLITLYNNEQQRTPGTRISLVQTQVEVQLRSRVKEEIQNSGGIQNGAGLVVAGTPGVRMRHGERQTQQEAMKQQQCLANV